MTLVVGLFRRRHRRRHCHLQVLVLLVVVAPAAVVVTRLVHKIVSHVVHETPIDDRGQIVRVVPFLDAVAKAISYRMHLRLGRRVQ